MAAAKDVYEFEDDTDEKMEKKDGGHSFSKNW